MREEMITPFLPLGQYLKTSRDEDDQLLYFVVARAIAKNEERKRDIKISCSPHPFGDVPSQEVFSIHADQITEVLFEGFQNQDDEEFLDDLLEATGMRQPDHYSCKEEQPVPIVETIKAMKKREIEDPFYQIQIEEKKMSKNHFSGIHCNERTISGIKMYLLVVVKQVPLSKRHDQQYENRSRVSNNLLTDISKSSYFLCQ